MIIQIYGSDFLNEAFVNMGDGCKVVGKVLKGKDIIPVVQYAHVEDRIAERLNEITTYDSRLKFKLDKMVSMALKDLATKGSSYMYKNVKGVKGEAEPALVSRFIIEILTPTRKTNIEVALLMRYTLLRGSQVHKFYSKLMRDYKLTLDKDRIFTLETLATFCSFGEKGYRTFSNLKNCAVVNHVMGSFNETDEYVDDLEELMKQVGRL